jgi:hypothetical protein
MIRDPLGLIEASHSLQAVVGLCLGTVGVTLVATVVIVVLFVCYLRRQGRRQERLFDEVRDILGRLNGID